VGSLVFSKIDTVDYKDGGLYLVVWYANRPKVYDYCSATLNQSDGRFQGGMQKCFTVNKLKQTMEQFCFSL